MVRGSDECLVGVLHSPVFALVRWDRLLSFLPLLLLLGGGLGLAVAALRRSIVLAAEMVEALAEHVTFFEGVINPSLVIRAGLLEHVVE